MRLYLVRHGEAMPKHLDPERPLSTQGQKDVQKMASFLLPHHLKVREVWHSGKLRARQTAEILATAIIPEKELREVTGLSPNDSIFPVKEKIEKSGESLMIVGHLPFMDKLLADLLTRGESRDLLTFPAGGIACLEKSDSPSWRLLWFLGPDLVA